MTPLAPLALPLADAEATARLGTMLAPLLHAGDVLLLEGPIGAGKTHFARTLIQERLRTAGLPPEDVPSPSFTLVQVYDAAGTEIWHADLFRLGNVAEADELGLSDAYDTAICLIEWPERLGPEAPADALRLAFAYDGEARIVTLSASAPRWRPILADLRREYATLRAQGAT